MEMIKELLDSLRAKSKRGSNFLLKNHIKETILKAIQIKGFIEKNKKYIKYKFGDNFFKNLIIACFLHDLGKISLDFQKKVYNKSEKEYDEKTKQYKNNNFDLIVKFFKNYKNMKIDDHEVISIIYSFIFLDDDEDSSEIRSAILLHHYNNFYSKKEKHIINIFSDYQDIKEYIKFLIDKENEILELLKKLLEYLKNDQDIVKDRDAINIFNKFLQKIEDEKLGKIHELKKVLDMSVGISRNFLFFEMQSSSSDGQKYNQDYDFYLLLGFLRRCDNSASGEVEIEIIQDLSDSIYKDLTTKIKKKIKQEGRIWQEDVLNIEDSDNMILVAPTGSGKTEFALLWAKNRGRKLIYTLPLRAALNDLFFRFGKYNENKNNYFDSKNLGILHSTAFIEFLKGEMEGRQIDIEDKINSTYMFSFPVMLSTPDQVLLSSLKFYGFDKILSIYPLSSIIIDEIQAYKPEMASVIIKTLEIIKKVNGNILIITATYPPYFEKFFKDFKIVYINHLIKNKKIDKKKVKNYNLKRHMVELMEDCIFEYKEDDGLKELQIKNFDKIKDIINKNKNKNILIIVNNVGKAIELYKKIENHSKDLNLIPYDVNNKDNNANLFLLHSRLIEKEKDRRIQIIKEKLEIGNERVILVSTQIVEASVDVDFDMLITEISPIDSQIQRWGRVYRNREIDYKFNEPNIIIFAGKCDNNKLEIDKGTLAIYDRDVIEKTIKFLKDKQKEFLDYEKEKELIEAVFNSREKNNLSLKEKYEREIEKNLEWLNYYLVEKKMHAQRLFRKISGIQVVIPDLMGENEIEKAFYEIIKDKNNWILPWESEIGENILSKINKKLSQPVTKWKLLEILYSYSFNLPIFSFGDKNKYKNEILERECFKGFFVLSPKYKKYIDEFKKYGVNKLIDIDIDFEEINLDKDNII